MIKTLAAAVAVALTSQTANAQTFADTVDAAETIVTAEAVDQRTERANVLMVTFCTSSNQFGPVSLFHKRDFLPGDRPARCA